MQARLFALLLLATFFAPTVLAQDVDLPPVPPGQEARMMRNRLEGYRIRLSRARILCATARQKQDPSAETNCGLAEQLEQETAAFCEQAVAANVVRAAAVCASLLRSDEETN